MEPSDWTRDQDLHWAWIRSSLNNSVRVLYYLQSNLTMLRGRALTAHLMHASEQCSMLRLHINARSMMEACCEAHACKASGGYLHEGQGEPLPAEDL